MTPRPGDRIALDNFDHIDYGTIVDEERPGRFRIRWDDGFKDPADDTGLYGVAEFRVVEESPCP